MAVRRTQERDPEGLAALVGTHASVLRRAFDDGRRAYGELPLPLETFARRFLALTGRRLIASGVERTKACVAKDDA